MHRGAAPPALRPSGEARPQRGHVMTAPLKQSDPITVEIALGERAYEIVIGRDVLQSLGRRVADLRPAARVAVITDRNVANHWLATTEASLAAAGVTASH